MFVGVGAVKNVMFVEDDSTQFTLTWEEPFHSQDVISLYYLVSFIALDALNREDLNTTNTSVEWRITNCGQYQLDVTAYGNRGVDIFPYETAVVAVYHNFTFSGGKTSSVIKLLFVLSSSYYFLYSLSIICIGGQYKNCISGIHYMQC